MVLLSMCYHLFSLLDYHNELWLSTTFWNFLKRTFWNEICCCSLLIVIPYHNVLLLSTTILKYFSISLFVPLYYSNNTIFQKLDYFTDCHNKSKTFIHPTEKYRNTVNFAPMGVDQTQKIAAFSTPGYSWFTYRPS